MNPAPTTLPAGLKGLPHDHAGVPLAEVGRLGWHLLDGRLPLPLAVLRRSALEHNVRWMQEFVRARGIDLAPHGKTTMSPQLFARQLEAGAWGLTFATVAQLAVGVAAGARRALIANQVVQDDDLAGIRSLQRAHDGLRVVFLVDSLAQLALIEDWAARHAAGPPFEVMLEIGMEGGRTGCRNADAAATLARALRASPAVRLVGVECYEGLAATGRSDEDVPRTAALMDRVEAAARLCAAEALFETDEVLLSAGGSAIFDLVAGRLRPNLGRSMRGLLRPGCYITHDHGNYRRMLDTLAQRCGCAETLRPALEVWTTVQSCPEPGLAILTCGRRDISFDSALPTPCARAPRGMRTARAVPEGWRITGLNDQHAYLRWDAADTALAPAVGERVGLGVSHPCTTFDKWSWMPVVDDDYRVVDAVTTHFG